MNADDSVRFLRQMQELLAEGGFVATYKFALLQALADLSVEHQTQSDGSLRIPVDSIAEKFIAYYWNQARPFRDEVLRQNTSGQAEVVSLLREYRGRTEGKLAKLLSNDRDWPRVRSRISAIIIKMPLWRLQTIGNTQNEFLYKASEYKDRSIRLLTGVPQAFRAFHPLLTEIFRGAWISQIYRISANRTILGPEAELEEFLFGLDRNSLNKYRGVLREHQKKQCFYCGKSVQSGGQLDHFIPWSRYPTDLGHNFVFAHAGCNNAKKDHLAAVEHLARWRDQNLHRGDKLAYEFQRAGLVHDLERTYLIANWAYSQGHANGAKLWIRQREFESLDYRWQAVLRCPAPLQTAAQDPEHYG